MTVREYSISAYNHKNLKTLKLVTRDALPSFNSSIIGLMFGTFEVNGAAIEASASERDSPASAVFNALQSLAPSPHIATKNLLFF